MVDTILAKLKRPSDKNGELVDCNYLKGFTINLPKWFLKLKGHKHAKKPKDGSDTKVDDGLEVRYRDAYPELKSFLGDSFNKEILESVLADYPCLLSQDLAELFDNLSFCPV